jgi:deoxyribodipyrimidine photo-lyase
MLVVKGDPIKIFHSLISEYQIDTVYANEDYEPSAIKRDEEVGKYLSENGVELKLFKDQVIFAKDEIIKKDGKPYTVFTPYKNRWLDNYLIQKQPQLAIAKFDNFKKRDSNLPPLEKIGFKPADQFVRDFDLSNLDRYKKDRDFPALDITSHLSTHLRFGTVSIRQIMEQVYPRHMTFVSELIWREFFMQILYHFPRVVTENFKIKYNNVEWINDRETFDRWCNGMTGYPLVDAGMRELNATGYMHNRVRMVVAGFLCKHLLIDWRWGEAFFAEKLLDYELSSNNGNWQWAAGTGCDAAPYFRIFNPIRQQEKFDSKNQYIRKWVPEFDSKDYCTPIVDHDAARKRAIATYKEGMAV